jgi:small subunit ribosomal protein S6
MAFYENVFIARQDLSGTQAEALADQFTTILTENGGTVAKREYWGLRTLGFRIKKNRKGHYILLNLDAPAAAVQEMERNMRLHEDVLRHLTVRVDALEEGPSAMMQARTRDREGGGRRDRDDRFGGGDRFRDRDDRGPRGDRDDRPRDRDDRPRRDAEPAAAPAAGESEGAS